MPRTSAPMRWPAPPSPRRARRRKRWPKTWPRRRTRRREGRRNRNGIGPSADPASTRRSERLEHGLRARHLEGAGLLDIEQLDGPVIDEHGVALRALAETIAAAIELEPDRAGEVAIAVGEHLDLALDLLLLAPGIHDEGVVHREAGDRIDALCPELVRLLDEAREMLGRACRREGAGKREKHHLLALEELVGLNVLHAFRRHLLQLDGRNLVANLDGHRLSPCLSCFTEISPRNGFMAPTIDGHRLKIYRAVSATRPCPPAARSSAAVTWSVVMISGSGSPLGAPGP